MATSLCEDGRVECVVCLHPGVDAEDLRGQEAIRRIDRGDGDADEHRVEHFDLGRLQHVQRCVEQVLQV